MPRRQGQKKSTAELEQELINLLGYEDWGPVHKEYLEYVNLRRKKVKLSKTNQNLTAEEEHRMDAVYESWMKENLRLNKIRALEKAEKWEAKAGVACVVRSEVVGEVLNNFDNDNIGEVAVMEDVGGDDAMATDIGSGEDRNIGGQQSTREAAFDDVIENTTQSHVNAMEVHGIDIVGCSSGLNIDGG